MWSDELQQQTREYFKQFPIAAMKNIDGRFGVCALMNGIYTIEDRKTNEVYKFSSMEDLIAAKWALD
jgi:hypothetical protein